MFLQLWVWVERHQSFTVGTYMELHPSSISSASAGSAAEPPHQGSGPKPCSAIEHCGKGVDSENGASVSK